MCPGYEDFNLWQITVTDNIQFTVSTSTWLSLDLNIIFTGMVGFVDIFCSIEHLTGVFSPILQPTLSPVRICLFLCTEDWQWTNHWVYNPQLESLESLGIIRAIKETICTWKWLTKTGQNVEINPETIIVLTWYQGHGDWRSVTSSKQLFAATRNYGQKFRVKFVDCRGDEGVAPGYHWHFPVKLEQ